jgi:hypothetical protein
MTDRVTERLTVAIRCADKRYAPNGSGTKYYAEILRSELPDHGLTLALAGEQPVPSEAETVRRVLLDAFGDAVATHTLHPSQRDVLLGTHWYRNGTRGAFHCEARNWVRSGLAVCGAAIKNPGYTVTSPVPGQTKLCQRCLKAVQENDGAP